MADQKELPEGTDTVISGAAVESENEEQLIVREPKARDKMLEKVREGRGKLAGQAADKTRGLVGQGLERSSEALANVSKLVGDTAEGLDERLGEEYGDYARKAATAIDDVRLSMSIAPRPHTSPSTSSPPNGSRVQPDGVTGTTSVWPIRHRVGAITSHPSMRVTTDERRGVGVKTSKSRPTPSR